MSETAASADPDTDTLMTEDDLSPQLQDWLLTQLVNLANGFQIEFGITLNVGSGVISGTLISGKKFLEEVAEGIEKQKGIRPDDEMSFDKVMANFFRGWTSVYEDEIAPENSSANPMSQRPSYIHLKNAQSIIGGGTVIPSKGGVLWRGRISAIDGFTFGSLSFG